MDRTVSLCDSWLFYNGTKAPGLKGALLRKKVCLPQGNDGAFTIKRKFICPKQVNDTVTVFFDGSFSEITVYAGKTELSPIEQDGHTVYDVTKALKTGKTVITVTAPGGTVDKFYFSVRRDLNKK